MRKVVQFSENQRVYSSQDGEMYRVQTVDTLKKVLWESVDTITAIVSLLDKLGFDADDIATMQMMINESNAKRDGGRRFA